MYAIKLDKAGHFYSTRIVSEIFKDLFLYAGFKENTALCGGASLNSAIVEIKDAYSPYWGFSKYDIAANIAGSFYPIIRAKIHFFRNIDFKWSYDFFHSSYYKTLPYHAYKSFIDDYERHYYWATANIAGMYNSISKKNRIPTFLDFCFGVSAKNLDGKGSGQREYYMGIDVNLTKIKIDNNTFASTASKYLNFYHLPIPTVKIK